VTFQGGNSVPGSSPIVVYSWDFGNTRTMADRPDVSATTVYDEPGVYDVSLTVTDKNGLRDTATMQIKIVEEDVDVGPTAVIEGPSQAFVGDEVTFQGGNSVPGSSPIVVYSWDFGNTRAMADRPDVSATTVYDTPGVYNVALTVRDQNDLSDSASMQITIIEKDEPVELPTAVINAPQETKAGVPVRLDGSASQPGNGGNIVNFEWRFGDGNTANGPVVEHVYNNPGGFEIVLIVTDESGNSNNTLQGILGDGNLSRQHLNPPPNRNRQPLRNPTALHLKAPCGS